MRKLVVVAIVLNIALLLLFVYSNYYIWDAMRGEAILIL